MFTRNLCLLLVAVVLLSFYFSSETVEATRGLDLSVFQGEVSQSSWNCLKNSGYEFAIIHAWQSTGKSNPYVNTDIARARNAGFKYIDIYVFPDFHMGIQSAGNQLKQAVHNVTQQYGMVWIDIEAAQLWGHCNDNIAFLRNMISAGEQMGLHMGIYTSKYQWQAIMCDSHEFSRFQLWYPHYDNNPSFSDFSAFGGWTRPSIKQYHGTMDICGTQIDQNYY